MTRHSVIVCEGYHDRAFLSGWLAHAGCTDARKVPRYKHRNTAKDPYGEVLCGGHYGWVTKADRFIRVVPAGGKSNLNEKARDFLKTAEQPVPRPYNVVICLDPDTFANQPLPEPNLEGRALGLQSDEWKSISNDGLSGTLTDGTAIHLLRWSANDPPAAGIPAQQTFERLVCAALAATYPARAAAVENWLDGRPEPPADSVKVYAWSHMAGWYPDHGCQDFYQRIWDDEAIAPELLSRLDQCGATAILDQLLG